MAILNNGTTIGGYEAVHAGNIKTISGIVTCSVQDRIIYVNRTTGNDSNDGSITSKFKTIARAVKEIPMYIAHKYTINIAPAVYNEDLLITGKVGPGKVIVTSENTDRYSTNLVRVLGNTAAVEVKLITVTGVDCFIGVVNTTNNLNFVLTDASMTAATGLGVHVENNASCSISSSVISNKDTAIVANKSMVDVNAVSGVNNVTGYHCTAGIIRRHSCTMAGAVANSGGLVT